MLRDKSLLHIDSSLRNIFFKNRRSKVQQQMYDLALYTFKKSKIFGKISAMHYIKFEKKKRIF